MTEQTKFVIFVVVSTILGVASFVSLLGTADVAVKRKLMPRFAIGAGVLFLCFVYFITLQFWLIIFLTPIVALIMYLNIKFTNFCDSCGRPVMPLQNLQIRAKFCGRCGKEINWK